MSYEGDLVSTYDTIHKRLINGHTVAKRKPPFVPHSQTVFKELPALLMRIEAIEEAIKRINRFVIDGERISDKSCPHIPQLKTFPVEKIIKMVLEEQGLSRAEVASGRRKSDLVMARHIIFYLCSRWTMRTLSEIGRTVGVQDHTTVMHGIRKIMLKRTVDADIDIKLGKYEDKLKELVNIGDSGLQKVSEQV